MTSALRPIAEKTHKIPLTSYNAIAFRALHCEAFENVGDALLTDGNKLEVKRKDTKS